jgi:hypothetical protein
VGLLVGISVWFWKSDRSLSSQLYIQCKETDCYVPQTSINHLPDTFFVFLFGNTTKTTQMSKTGLESHIVSV